MEGDVEKTYYRILAEYQAEVEEETQIFFMYFWRTIKTFVVVLAIVLGLPMAVFTYEQWEYDQKTPQKIQKQHLAMVAKIKTLRDGDFIELHDGRIAILMAQQPTNGMICVQFSIRQDPQLRSITHLSRISSKVVHKTDNGWCTYAQQFLLQ